MTKQAYIIDAIRTPLGKKNGSLALIHPADLAAINLRELMQRTDIDPSAVDDVILRVGREFEKKQPEGA